MFRCVALAGMIAFGLYTAMKAAYLSTRLRDARRGAQPHLHRPAAPRRHRARCSSGAAWTGGRSPRRRRTRSISSLRALSRDAVPYQMGVQLYRTRSASRSSSRRTATRTGRRTRPLGAARSSLAGGVVAMLAPALLRGRARLAGAIVGRAAVGIVGWNLTGEIAAAAGTNSIGTRSAAHAQPSVHLGRRHHAPAADALHRRRRSRSEPGVAARVLEPLDRARQQPRRLPRGPGPPAAQT